MPAPELRFRQIHLDFHTSEKIPLVGERFDPQVFAETLQQARVDSVTCFARCHHGWLYYDSAQFPHLVHPHLQRRDLLREQIEACHRHDIRVPIYLTVQWDQQTSQHHPEWTVQRADGRLAGTPPYEPGFYRVLCVNTPYRDYLKAITREVLQTLPVDGLFFDIVGVEDCSCPTCRDGMLAQGLDPAVQAHRLRYAQEMLDGFKQDMSTFVRELNRDCKIFYNAGHIGPSTRSSLVAYSHLELESLPSSGHWGYLHFPYSIRFARRLGPDCVGMTGKFHTEWGDFHSFKNQAALEYECFQMLAQTAKCSIGDQLHPDGALCPHVYELIGAVYRQVEAKEPWCRGAKPVVEIGVFTPEQWSGDKLPPAALGAVRMLQEAALQFDIIDSHSDFTLYKLLILPDRIPVNSELAKKLSAYLAAGGKALLTFESGLNPAGDAFAIDEIGVRLDEAQVCDESGEPVRGRYTFQNDFIDYIRPRPTLANGLAETEYALYTTGLRVIADEKAEVCADTVLPFFNRHWRHFCSHRQTPSSGEIGGTAVLAGERTVYFSHPIFEIYQRWAPRWCKILLINAVDRLLGERLLRHNGPSSLQVTLTEQPGRWNVHLLHYIPERRCEKIDIIEDVIPLHDLVLRIRVDRPVVRAAAVPQNEILSCRRDGGFIELTVPRLCGHQIVEMVFEEN